MNTSEGNQAILRRYAKEVWEEGNLPAIENYIASHYVRHDPGLPAEVRGPDGIRQLVPLYRAAFPDINFTADVLFGVDDMVAVRWLVRGTHRGELMGIPATGRPLSITAIELFRFEGGKIAEQWVLVDNLSMLQQLGAMPAPAAN